MLASHWGVSGGGGLKPTRCNFSGVIRYVPAITVCVPRGGQSASKLPANLPSHYQRSPCWNTMLTSECERLFVQDRSAGEGGSH